jgi:K+-transporting ATPase ATPase A chain
MTIFGWLQIGLYLLVLLLLVKPLGSYMAKVYQGEHNILTCIVGPVERLVYRVIGVRHDDDMDWKTYAIATLIFGLVGIRFSDT